jgi:hypothetical protein
MAIAVRVRLAHRRNGAIVSLVSVHAVTQTAVSFVPILSTSMVTAVRCGVACRRDGTIAFSVVAEAIAEAPILFV